MIEQAAETEALAASLDGNDGVYFVPALTGLGSPHWDPYARGTIVGLTRGTGRAHLARAALEAIAYQTVDAVRAMEADRRRAADRAQGRRRRDGERLADAVPGRRARRPGRRARGRRRRPRSGRRYLAGVGTGAWTLDQVGASWRERARYEPAMPDDERDALLAEWRRARGARARVGDGRHVTTAKGRGRPGQR